MKIFFKYQFKNFCRALFLGVLIFGFSFAPASAQVEQTGSSTLSDYYNLGWLQILGNNLLGEITDISVKVGNFANDSDPVVSVRLCEWDTEADMNTYGDCSGGVSANAVVSGVDNTATENSVLSDAELNFSGLPFTFDQTKYYSLFVGKNTNSGLSIYGSANSGAYRDPLSEEPGFYDANTTFNAGTNDNESGSSAGDCAPDGSQCRVQATDTTLRDIYFVFAGTNITGIDYDIEWESPAQGEILAGYPSHLRITFEASQNSCVSFQGIVDGTAGSSTLSCFNAGSHTIDYPNPGTVATGTIQANMAFYNFSSQLVATSTITFSVLSETILENGSGLGPELLLPDPESPTSPFFVDCSAYDISLFSSSTLEGVGCVLKKTALGVVSILFVPSMSLTFFQESIEDFKLVFPFSIFFEIQETISDASSGSLSSASSTLTWNYPIGGQTIPITFSSSSLSSVIGTDLKNLYFTIARMFLWLGLIAGLWGFVYHELFGQKEYDTITGKGTVGEAMYEADRKRGGSGYDWM